MAEKTKNTYNIILKIYEEMIKQIEKEREDFIDYSDSLALGKNMNMFVKLIKTGKAEDIDGDLAYKVQL